MSDGDAEKAMTLALEALEQLGKLADAVETIAGEVAKLATGGQVSSDNAKAAGIIAGEVKRDRAT